jgi:hypothetical protein
MPILSLEGTFKKPKTAVANEIMVELILGPRASRPLVA